MFVSGVPEETDRHAQKVANCSLDMVTVVGEVRSPATGKPIQVKNMRVSKHFWVSSIHGVGNAIT